MDGNNDNDNLAEQPAPKRAHIAASMAPIQDEMDLDPDDHKVPSYALQIYETLLAAALLLVSGFKALIIKTHKTGEAVTKISAMISRNEVPTSMAPKINISIPDAYADHKNKIDDIYKKASLEATKALLEVRLLEHHDFAAKADSTSFAIEAAQKVCADLDLLPEGTLSQDVREAISWNIKEQVKIACNKTKIEFETEQLNKAFAKALKLKAQAQDEAKIEDALDNNQAQLIGHLVQTSVDKALVPVNNKLKQLFPKAGGQSQSPPPGQPTGKKPTEKMKGKPKPNQNKTKNGNKPTPKSKKKDKAKPKTKKKKKKEPPPQGGDASKKASSKKQVPA